MSKRNLLITAVVVLCLANIAFLVMHFFGPKHGPPNKMAKMEMVNDELCLNGLQRKAYLKLVLAHQEKNQKLRKKQTAIKIALYKTIGEESKDSERVFQMEKLNMINDEIEFLNLEHFDDIRKLCKGDQIEKFKKFRSKLDSFFGPPKLLRKK